MKNLRILFDSTGILSFESLKSNNRTTKHCKMNLYGIIEDGVLRTQEIVQHTERIQVVKDDKPTIQERIITVDEQIQEITKAGWKPVDMIDESKLECAPGYAIRIVAVEYDDHIGYTYEKIQNLAYYKNQIKALKEELDNTDYKVIKCYEAKIMGLDLPYDAKQIHKERQQLRDEINALENKLDDILRVAKDNE